LSLLISWNMNTGFFCRSCSSAPRTCTGSCTELNTSNRTRW
jgi:hypothetical protein